MESSGDQLLASFVGTSYNWSRIWGLTSSDFLPIFIDSLFFLYIVFEIYFTFMAAVFLFA